MARMVSAWAGIALGREITEASAEFGRACPIRTGAPAAVDRPSTGRLEQLHHIARGILAEDLPAAGPGDDLVAEGNTLGAEPGHEGFEILDLEAEVAGVEGDCRIDITHDVAHDRH